MSPTGLVDFTIKGEKEKKISIFEEGRSYFSLQWNSDIISWFIGIHTKSEFAFCLICLRCYLKISLLIPNWWRKGILTQIVYYLWFPRKKNKAKICHLLLWDMLLAVYENTNDISAHDLESQLKLFYELNLYYVGTEPRTYWM